MKPVRYPSLEAFFQAWQQDALKAVQPIPRVPLPEAWRPFSTGPSPVPPKADDAKPQQ